MPVANAIADPAATSLDRSEGSATHALYGGAIGSINAAYYLPIFERFEAAGHAGPCWNWAAGLCTLNWMAFRKMWGAALVYVALWGVAAFLLLGLGQVFRFSEVTQRDLWLGQGFLSVVIPGFYGNAWLYTACRKEMARALAANTTLPEACTMLNQRASSRRHFVVLALLNLVVLGVAAGVYLSSQKTDSQANAAKPGAASNLAVGRAIDLPAPQAPQQKPEPIAPPPAPAPVPPVKPQVAPPKFHINVGLFASDTNARNAYAKLKQAGLPAYTQEVESKQGKRTRVRVGPFETRADAEAAAETIHALKLDAIVFEP